LTSSLYTIIMNITWRKLFCLQMIICTHIIIYITKWLDELIDQEKQNRNGKNMFSIFSPIEIRVIIRKKVFDIVFYL
jgi:hypothetical protein